MTSQFSYMAPSSFFEGVLFLLSSLATGPSFNIITGSGVITTYFYKGLARYPEIGNTLSKFFPISGDYGELGIPNLPLLFVIKCYGMLQNTRVTAFTISELLRENQLGWGGGVKSHPD